VFSVCIVLVIFFSYITIVVNLYDTAHGKKIKELFLVFVFTTYTNIYLFFLLLAFVFTGVFNLYRIGYFFLFFLYNHCCQSVKEMKIMLIY
jgi:hypothetical protein